MHPKSYTLIEVHILMLKKEKIQTDITFIIRLTYSFLNFRGHFRFDVFYLENIIIAKNLLTKITFDVIMICRCNYAFLQKGFDGL